MDGHGMKWLQRGMAAAAFLGLGPVAGAAIISNVFSAGFEGGSTQTFWRLQAPWEIGQPWAGPLQADAGTNCLGTGLTENYPDGTTARVESATLTLPVAAPLSTLTLSYREWYNLESSRDYGRFQIATNTPITWSIPTWSNSGSAGAAQQTPDLAPIVQELVNRPGWVGGNAMAILFTGTGQRIAHAFDGAPLSAAVLSIQWESGGVTDQLAVAIGSSADDAEEYTNGTVSLDGSDIELVRDDWDNRGNQTVGLRFPSIGIPNGANILSANVQFTTDEPTNATTTVYVWGEASDSAAPFTTTPYSLSSRPRVAAFTNWSTISTITGTSAWHDSAMNLTAYMGQSLRLGFHLTSDDTLRRPGWFLDSMSLDYAYPAALAVNVSSINAQNFPYVFIHATVQTNGVLATNLAGGQFAVWENGMVQTNAFEVLAPGANGEARLADIVFVMDNSGSMSAEQAAVAQNVTNFVNNLQGAGIDFALGLCRYGQSMSNGNPIVEDNGILTSDPNYFVGTVWARNVIDGGSEPGFMAIDSSTRAFNFRSGSQRIIIIITDETPVQGTVTEAQAVSACQSVGATVFSVSGTTLYDEFNTIVTTTGGQSFDIADDFDGILTTISEFISSTFMIRYRSSDTTANPTSRAVRVTFTQSGTSATNDSAFTPGAAPRIERSDYTTGLHSSPVTSGVPLLIEARVTDQVAPDVESVTLYYRVTDTVNFNALAMGRATGTLWQATVPGVSVTAPGLDYFFLATDGELTTSDPGLEPQDTFYQVAVAPNVAPVVTHIPIVSPTLNVPMVVTASVVDVTAGVVGAQLFYRKTGQLLYQVLDMTPGTATLYTGSVPASHVTADGVDYYIRAEDSVLVSSYHGTPDKPHQTLAPHLMVSPTVLTQSLFTGQSATQWVQVTYSSGSGGLSCEAVPGDDVQPGIVRFAPMGGYLSVTGAALSVGVIFDATSLSNGMHDASFAIRSNDPDQPRVDVAATLSVTSAPDLVASPLAVNFGNVVVGLVATQNLIITNQGFAPLTVLSMQPTLSSLSLATGSVVIVPMAALTNPLVFAPLASGAQTGVVVLTTDDPDTPVLNIAISGAGLAAPLMVVTPATLNQNLTRGTVVTQVLVVSNAGATDLDFALTLAMASNASPHARDSYGYTWLDNDDTNGPDIRTGWFDISAFGTVLMTGSVSSASVTLNTPLDFYGKVATRVTAYSSGYLYFYDAASSLLGYLNFFSQGLSTGYGTNFVYQDPVTRRTYIQYQQRKSAGSNTFVTLQIQLCEGGDMYLYYPVATNSGSLATLYGVSATLQLYDGFLDIITNDRAFHVRAPSTFLKAEGGQSGRVGAGLGRSLPMSIDSGGLTPGAYTGAVTVTGNDPANPQDVVPVSLTVSGESDWYVDLPHSRTNLGTVFVGYPAEGVIRIVNAGTGPLTVSNIVSSRSELLLATNRCVVPPLDSCQLRTWINATGTGVIAGTVTLSTDSFDAPQAVVAVLGTAIQPARMVVSPLAITNTVHVGLTKQHSILVSNSGPGTLSFVVSVLNGGGTYTWKDSDQAGGPAYQWTDIAGSGTLVSLPSDDSYTTVSLPFAFPFYGQTRTSIVVSANGYITMGDAASSFSNTGLPSSGTPNGLIAAMWDDLNPGTGTVHVLYHSGLGRYVIQYSGWERLGYGSLTRFNFQIQLAPNGDIYLYYKSLVGTNYLTPTIGIEDYAGTQGVQIATSYSYLHDQLAVRIHPASPFLSTDLVSASLGNGGISLFHALLDATAQDESYRDGLITLTTSSDPGLSSVQIPVRMYVEGLQASLDYGPWSTNYWPSGVGAAQTNDPDGDGANNWEEWVAGTDPTLVNSHFAIADSTGLTSMVISWQTITNRFYQVQGSTNMAGQWTNVASSFYTNAPGRGTVMKFTNSTGSRTGQFFRVRARRP